MQKKDTFAGVLATLGTVLVWLPILATVVTGTAGSLRARVFIVDYLMPAELFPAAFVGGLLLVWTAARSRRRRGLVGLSFTLMVVLLIGIQVFAVVTGLASGATEPAGWPLALVLGALAAYSLALVLLAVAGVQLLRDLFLSHAAGGVSDPPIM